ncbi:MAG: DNA polymerase IV [Candidatus Latescibacterota bacterium]|nr:DNA polymerase IV [Candidatus Latescibacterota bacterium]
MQTIRKILHLDLDAFFCAVEVLRNPSLDGKRFAVGGSADGRGVVSSCSYAARKFGVRSAMPMSRAMRICPGLIAVPHGGGYGRLSRKVIEQLDSLTPNVEQISIDEAFIDVSDIPEPSEAIARDIQTMIREKLRLPCSLGGATSKLVAKIATNVGKSSADTDRWPSAIHIVPAGQEAEFLAPLPIQAMWGVGPKSAERLQQTGIRKLGELQGWSSEALESKLGSYGPRLKQFALGIDDRPVSSGSHEAKSISSETTFDEDIADRDRLHAVLLSLSQRVGRSLRDEALVARTVTIKLRWSDFRTITRRITIPDATDLDQPIYAAAKSLFEKAWQGEAPVRLLGVGASNLAAGGQQLSLFSQMDDKDHRVQESLDDLRDRFGSSKTRWGREHSHQTDRWSDAEEEEGEVF